MATQNPGDGSNTAHTGGAPRWDDGGAYESYVGRWSRRVAREFVVWLDAPAHAAWLDIGCGSGALTHTILALADPTTVRGIDRSPDFAAYVRAHTADPRASFAVGDAQAIPEPDAIGDVVVSGLMLNFAPEPARVTTELARIIRPGGVLGVYVWDYTGGMQMMRYFWETVAALNPMDAALDERNRFANIALGDLTHLFIEAGLRDVEFRSIEIPTNFHDFDDYWTPFLSGQGPAPGYVMALSEEQRATLRESLRSRLPIAADGSISLNARAWAVKGRR